ncbi:hypothetical protein K437DRAFT_294875 [Tilletiaria anomala UBC 951]|uniref:CBF1-interacting co-repressor CIR N-terminal domain-containing protein n=1 Tax=Tilletiaria anomala (strain ATCC 24038 / CBS 436.72 / UBC 951) TaxID=1037660 RepID=A0A066VVU7_TILAU|nr:uncharacterized protein K437DRAFT_294875 [Tilletiaria anomala UBC 951]KDN44388.1 hypothetical protein K437DRAFT_294875 [Tilletiaria anomala UBC 951]
MGGGDLNMKKSWHPLLMVNQERVWKQEKKAFEERKKLEELRRERDQEREMQELQRLQEEAGGKKRQEKVDWMYATPSTGGGPSAGDLEDYLLGKKRVDKLLRADEGQHLSKASGEETFMAIQNANTAQDLAAKVREDPLVTIKRQEQAAYEALLRDPTRLRELRKANGLDTGEDKEARRRRKEEKRRAKEERRASRHAQSKGRGSSMSRSLSPRRSCSPARRDRDESRRHNDYYERLPKTRSPAECRYRDQESRYTSRDRDHSSSRSYEYRRADRREAPYRREGTGDHQPLLARPPQSSRAEYRVSPSDAGPSSRSRWPETGDPRHPRSTSRDQGRPSIESSSSTTRPPASSSAAGEDAAAKLARMMGNAVAVQSERTALLSRVEAEEAAERAQQEADQEKARKRYGTHACSDAPKADFLIDQQRKMVGGSNIDLGERLARGRQGLQRIEAD